MGAVATCDPLTGQLGWKGRNYVYLNVISLDSVDYTGIQRLSEPSILFYDIIKSIAGRNNREGARNSCGGTDQTSQWRA